MTKNKVTLAVILRRYITQQVATTTLIVLLFLMALLLGGRLVRYFGMAAEGSLDIRLLFGIIAYNIPTFLELILPLAFFVALMLTFGRMYVDNEMSVLFSSGQSRARLTQIILPLIVILFVLEGFLSLWAKPYGLANSEKLWHTQSLSSAIDLIKPKTFISSGDYHFYVGDVDKKNKRLRDLYVIQTAQNDKQRDIIITAKQAEQLPSHADDNVSRLDLVDGKRYEMDSHSRVYNQIQFERYRISIAKPSSEQVSTQNIATQPSFTLLKHWHKPEAKAELGYRLTLPFLIIIACLLATPLAQVQPRQGRWLRLMPAILLFVACAVSIISLKTNISKQKLSYLAYVWFGLLVLAGCVWLNIQQTVLYRLSYRKHIATTAQQESV